MGDKRSPKLTCFKAFIYMREAVNEIRMHFHNFEVKFESTMHIKSCKHWETALDTDIVSCISTSSDTSSNQPKPFRRVRLQPPTLRTGVRGRQFNRQRGKCSWLLKFSLFQTIFSTFFLWGPYMKYYFIWLHLLVRHWVIQRPCPNFQCATLRAL